MFARMIAHKLNEVNGYTIVVENPKPAVRDARPPGRKPSFGRQRRFDLPPRERSGFACLNNIPDL